MAQWSFLTDHARVLVCMAHDRGVWLRDIAGMFRHHRAQCLRIVTDLTEAGYVVKTKDGRRNRHQTQTHLPPRGTITQERTIGEVLDLLLNTNTAGHDWASPETVEGC
jgi:hypothetical protein